MKFKKLVTFSGLVEVFPSNFKDKKGRIRDEVGRIIFDPNQKKTAVKFKAKTVLHNRKNILRNENYLRSKNVFEQFTN